HPHPRWKAFSGDEGSFSHSSSESEAYADEGQPPSKRPRENLFGEEPLVCDAVVTKEGEAFFSDQILGLLEGIPGILDLAAEMGFSWISLSQPWKGNDLHWLKLMRTSFRFSDEESESDDASMAASMDSEGEVAFVHGIDAVLDMPIKIYLELAKPWLLGTCGGRITCVATCFLLLWLRSGMKPSVHTTDHPHPRWKAFSGDEGSFSHSSSESEAYADEGQPPSKRPRENLFGEEPLVCDAVVTKEGEAFFSDQILGLLEGIPGILDLAAEMGFS
ncbi:hypothetical protein P4O66_021742, partial [Electrophorus voltai]